MQTTNYADYPALALRTEKKLPTVIDRLEHAALGLITESGEIVTEVKRIAIYFQSLDSFVKGSTTVTLRDHIAEEVGDSFWYVPIITDALGLDFFPRVLPEIQPLRRDGADQTERLKQAAFSLSAAVGRFANQVQYRRKYPTVVELSFDRDVQGLLYQIGQALVDILDIIGVPLSDALGDNIAKLQKRYPDAYSDAAAEARADKGGLSARES